jgi:two-component system sensor histidine kinase ResE
LEISDEPVVMGDSTRVQQVLRNLLENAARYAESLIRIRVERVPDKNEIRITISDDGPGIPVEELPYVFQRFYRVEKSRTRGQGGTGLGLAIARQIVEAHDGTITAGLSKDGGAEFVFTLPIAIVPEGETIA